MISQLYIQDQITKWNSILRPVRFSLSDLFLPSYQNEAKLTPPYIIAEYLTSDKSSFAYVSAHDRWPVILVRNSMSFLCERGGKVLVC